MIDLKSKIENKIYQPMKDKSNTNKFILLFAVNFSLASNTSL